ncbi:MAG: succinate dehydrogenase, hydrophobic membrane anchor protein [Wenzhouxiangella sp.]|nr:succinate dehydrogenase, hydrophobic membrane anchor protein [Wenzhouxiangella sp.]MCH8478486.1 succinate dehydrogenase, hydrophobic membrane anchor protein [Wenzhouxiangella sp.]TVR96240.1 MAG: succinate dehydrogenase, hydrophobic membrane anchor protein [Wenzhouxiangellaceae bacterium]
MNLRHPIANAHNHGAAGDGVGHWWAQRFSAILLAFLSIWLVYALASVVGADHSTASAWLARPFNAAMAILFVVTSLYHGKLGLQVVIEDYVKGRFLEVSLQIAVKILAIVGGLLAVLAILKVALGV